jgi:hypothetical protein
MRFLTAGLLAAALLTVVMNDTAVACTAGTVIDRADEMIRTDEYANAERAVMEQIAHPRGWTWQAAVKAAAGAMFWDAWDEDAEGYPELTSLERAVAFLNNPITARHGRTEIWIDGKVFLMTTVGEHAAMHGQEWESHMDMYGNPLPDWWNVEIDWTDLPIGPPEVETEPETDSTPAPAQSFLDYAG